MDTAECFADHMGPWCIDPAWMRQAVAAIKAGTWQPRAARPSQVARDDPDRLPYDLVDGVAVVSLNGPMMKGQSKFGGASTVDARRALRAAADARKVSSILLHIDSPGGHVAGTAELAAEVSRVGGIKPLVAHIDDMGCSAAFWVASQAQRITMNATGVVGSIGILAVVEDTSGAAEKAGVEVHVIATGPAKGDLIDGKPVTAEALERIQERVDGLFSHFASAVQGGRRMSAEQFAAVADGRVFGSADALRLGLVDGVESMEQVLGGLIQQRQDRARRVAARAQMLDL